MAEQDTTPAADNAAPEETPESTQTAPASLALDEPEPEVIDDDESATPDDEEEPAKLDDRAKEFQRVNQNVGNLKRELKGIKGMFETLMQRTEAGAKPAETQKTASALRDKLQALFDEKRDPLDSLSVQEARVFAENIEELQKALARGNDPDPRLQQQLAAASDMAHRADFNGRYPTLAGKYDEMVGDAKERVGHIPAQHRKGPLWEELSGRVWSEVVNEYKGKSAQTPVKPKETPKPVPGAKFTGTSAAGTRPATTISDPNAHMAKVARELFGG